jgi:molybdopterin-guanine dinucleotide biosynthesis protein A
VSRAGYVLVGGRSTRMGRDKALLRYRGGCLVESVAAAVASAAGGVTLIGNPAIYTHLGFPVIPDRFPGEGPLTGILTALAHSTADWNLVVACDMPEVTVATLSRLLDAAGEQAADVLVPAGPSGLLEPLCAVYHRRSYPALQAAFDKGVRKVTAAFEGMKTVVFHVTEAASFHNVNTPDDWAGYATD